MVPAAHQVPEETVDDADVDGKEQAVRLAGHLHGEEPGKKCTYAKAAATQSAVRASML